MNELISRYLTQSSMIYYKLIDTGINPEDARFFLPNGLVSNILFTMNGRELRHFLKLRLDKNAQWEIRELAQNILKIMNDICPVLVFDIKDGFPQLEDEYKNLSNIPKQYIVANSSISFTDEKFVDESKKQISNKGGKNDTGKR